MNLQEQKTALVEWAPEVFHVSHIQAFYWTDTGWLISDREWLEVAWWLEERFIEHPNTKIDDLSLYYDYLALCVGWPKGKTIGDTKFIVAFNVMRATAPQRLEALCRVLWPERFK